jgi:hypothetical protein
MFGFEKVSSLTKFNFLLKVVRHQLVPFEKKMKQSQSTCALCTGTLAFLFDLFFFGGGGVGRDGLY